MNKEKIIKDFINYLNQDIQNKDFLTYQEQDEWKDYINRIINNQVKEKDKEIERLNNIIKIMEKYFELIADLGYDYDGLNKIEDLKKLIDELVKYADLGRVYNITEPIFINKDKKYNILNEELKEGK